MYKTISSLVDMVLVQSSGGFFVGRNLPNFLFKATYLKNLTWYSKESKESDMCIRIDLTIFFKHEMSWLHRLRS